MCILHIVFCTVCKYVLSICKLLLFFLHCLSICKLLLFFCTVCPYVNFLLFFCTVCPYVNCCCCFFCTVWSTLIRISLTKALVLWWCDNKSDLIWFDLILFIGHLRPLLVFVFCTVNINCTINCISLDSDSLYYCTLLHTSLFHNFNLQHKLLYTNSVSSLSLFFKYSTSHDEWWDCIKSDRTFILQKVELQELS